MLCLFIQLYPALCDTMDCSPSGYTVHGDSPGKNTGVGCHALLQGIFPTQGFHRDLLHCRWILYSLSQQGSPIASWQIEGEKVEVMTNFLSLGSKIIVDGYCSHEIRIFLLLGRKANCVEKQRHYSDDKGPYSQGQSLPSGHVRLWKPDRKEGRVPKK